jgi:pyridoxal phosphate enzyme (YggS family)
VRLDDRVVTRSDEAQVERIRRVVAHVNERTRAAGRPTGAVAVVAVTKTLPPTAVLAAYAAGLRDVGENYVQEARDKRRACDADVTWHLIGTLQRNKAGAAARTFDRVHSLDDAAVALALDAAAERAGRFLPALIQVDAGDHPAGRGVRPADLQAMVATVGRLRRLVLDGLMCIASPGCSEAETRATFRRLRSLRDEAAAASGLELPHLSMGMSDDYPIAIDEGATFVRLGRTLFGARGERSWRETE